MSIRRQAHTVQQQVRKRIKGVFAMLHRSLRFCVAQLLRGLFFLGVSRKHSAKAGSLGFILPTTVLLLLVVSLAVGAISLRTYSRTQETIGERQQQVIYNAATPAIDRAKAKIAYLLERHKRTTSGVPPEGDLLKMMLNTDPSFGDDALDFRNRTIADVYTFNRDDNGNQLPPEDAEARIDIDGDGTVDNAWAFQADIDGNGTKDAWIAYSIIFSTPGQNQGTVVQDDNGEEIIRELKDSRPVAVKARAESLEIRNAPKSLLGSSERCPAAQEAGVEAGWFSDEINKSFLRKNFQVNALVIPGRQDENGTLVPDPNATVETLEMQQDRTFDLGNKWGAWFQNDLEIFPGEPFNWNGAMRTQGSLIMGINDFEGYLISSRYSCFNLEPAASEIRVGRNIVSGQVKNTNNFHSAPIHLFRGFQDPETPTVKRLGQGRDDDDKGTAKDADYQEISEILLLDPVQVFLGTQPSATEDLLRGDVAANAVALGWTDPEDPEDGWNAVSPLNERITVQVPNEDDNVDYGDTYRSDDRVDGVSVAINGDDGEWEKTASQQGMRIIVGQRLELGNPLNPWDGTIACDASGNALQRQNSNRCHEARQRRTLKDNLAAVQATAIYHADVTEQPAISDGNETLACLATTVHPGTASTLQKAASFHNFYADLGREDDSFAIEDFFSGQGTNGWEFQTPSEASNPNKLEQAVENLAHFAGDPKAGAPSFAPIQDDFVHPYPLLSMWGDFSMLRRVDTGNNDSLADGTTEDTAKCMLGMLAHNITYLNDFDLLDPITLSPLLIPGTQLFNDITDINANIDPSASSPEEALESLDTNLAGDPDKDRKMNIAYMLRVKEQVRRDRDYGFESGGSDDVRAGGVGRLGCEQEFGSFSNLSVLCFDDPKYPALYSIFPGDTNHDGIINPSRNPVTGDNHEEVGLNSADATRGFDPANPAALNYPDPTGNNYLLNTGSGTNVGVNASTFYGAFTDDDLKEIALAPRKMSEWVLPHKASTEATAAAPNSMKDVLIKCDATVACDSNDVSVAFKDAAIMDGRQLMNVRIMDLNLALLRESRSSAFGNDTWLATDHRSLVYAFREDAVREDAIVRPVDPARNGPCTTDAEVQAETCWLNAGAVTAYESTDPPLVDGTTSIKPVDYWTDPDRRPYGFRLRQGANMSRGQNLGVDESFSFVSDNPVYIMGNFNEHKAGGATIQEFTDLLDFNAFTINNFYNRGQNLGTVNQDFGTTRGDQWRPAEVLSEAVSILSNNFCDGSVEDLFDYSDVRGQLTALDTKYDCPVDEGFTSYTNYTDLTGTINIANLDRENPADDNSPILITANGNPLRAGVEYNERYDSPATNRDIHNIKAEETTVNVSIYSGIVPSRINVSYGGLHNFPRFLEEWKDEPLNISGAFFQLGFSTSSTAPYDQKNAPGDFNALSWEPNQASINVIEGADDGVTTEWYFPPERYWGYDVALQKNAPGAVASKFVSQTPLVSEFYTSLEVNDPYVYQLCEALDESNQGTDFQCLEPDS